MVLLTETEIVNLVPNSLQEFKTKYPGIYNTAKEFACRGIETVDSLYSLYIGQGEYAVIPSLDDAIKVVGSDEATTCHIVILKTDLGSVSVAHFDGSDHENEVMDKIISELVNLDGGLKYVEAYVIGGYYSEIEKERKCSEVLSLQILKYFVKTSVKIKLILWCTCESNTKFISDMAYPLFNGLAINRTTMEIFPANFPVQVPNNILRSASHWVTHSKYTCSLYNYNKKTVSIEPFHGWDRRQFAFYATLPDETLLLHFSTSPLVEPSSFCSRLRAAFELLGSAEELFPDNSPKIYNLNERGEWVELH